MCVCIRWEQTVRKANYRDLPLIHRERHLNRAELTGVDGKFSGKL